MLFCHTNLSADIPEKWARAQSSPLFPYNWPAHPGHHVTESRHPSRALQCHLPPGRRGHRGAYSWSISAGCSFRAMSLIECPECGRRVSSASVRCPGCGFRLQMGEVGFALGRIVSWVRRVSQIASRRLASRRRLKTPSRSSLVYWAISLFVYSFLALLLLGVLASLLAE